VAPDGTLAGYGYVGQRRHVRMDVEVYVHPAHLGRGIGASLIRLTEGRAREHVPLAPAGARVVLNNWINARNADARALLEREGYAPARYFWQMETELGDQPPPDWPAGLAVRGGTSGEDLRPYYETVQEAWAGQWGHVPTSFAEWVQRRTEGSFDPALWFMATEGDKSVGVALCSVSDGIGWVDTLAVRPAWRRRGLGLALLRHAFGEMRRRGLGRVGLGVDAANPTGATRLYERAGMCVAHQYATYSKELRPGVELSELDEGDG
jgi:mycothiol synthase